MINESNTLYKELILSSPYTICIERARTYTRIFKETESEHPAMRAAKALAATLKEMSIYILPEETIAGNRASSPVAVVIPVERGDINSVIDLDLELLTSRKEKPFQISEADKRELLEEILPYWKGKSVRDLKNSLYRENGLFFSMELNPLSIYKRFKGLDIPRIRKFLASPNRSMDYARKGLEGLLYNNPAMLTNVFDVQGHLILGHKNVMREGFRGIEEQARAGLKEAEKDKKPFLNALIISCEAVRDFAARYAHEAELLLKETKDKKRREELQRIARYCRHVPYNPPRDFREALQALWLTQAAAHISYGIAGIFATGRIDQYLYPFYARDIKEGNILPEDVVAAFEELLIKLSCGLLMIPNVGKRTASELGSDTASPTVGGVDRKGKDAVNELSYHFIDAFNNVKSMGNSFTIRLSGENHPAFWSKALETYRHTSGAALYNDEIAIKALENCGYEKEDARDYGVIGCVEPTGDGDTFGCTSGNDLSMVAALEMALLDGYLRIMGKQIGPQTGNPLNFKNFEELMAAFKKQLSFLINVVASCVNIKDGIYRDGFPNPYVSSTLSGCVAKARDMTSGGAKYSFESMSGRGLGTAVDSLAAIKYFVYDTGKISMKRLLRALNNNFKKEEKLRVMLQIKGPKYGCGNPVADALAKEVAEFFCREVATHKSIFGTSFRPGFFSYGMHVLDGMLLGATPDGRHAGDPVSNSFSPSNNTENKGPTAMLKSVAGIDHTLIANGCALNMKMLPEMFREDERLDKVRAMVRSFFDLGGMELQLNVLDNKTLLAAQEDPEAYKDLVVRVSGYSAYFTDLGRPLQDEIISRTEFGKL